MELEFVTLPAAFVFDVELGVKRDAQALAGDLDREGVPGPDCVGQAAQLGGKGRTPVAFRAVAIARGDFLRE